LIETEANLFVSGQEERDANPPQQQPEILPQRPDQHFRIPPARLNRVGSTTIQELVRLRRPSTAPHAAFGVVNGIMTGTVVAAVCSGGGQPIEQAIRERAYQIWEAEGRADGKELDHWLRAEAEVIAFGEDV
jgi:hypothetical protein